MTRITVSLLLTHLLEGEIKNISEIIFGIHYQNKITVVNEILLGQHSFYPPPPLQKGKGWVKRGRRVLKKILKGERA